MRPEAPADDGKRAASVLGVDVSPLRATKGGSLRGGGSSKRRRGGGVSADFAYIGILFRFCFECFFTIDFDAFFGAFGLQNGS